jgi:hypothetical protein
MFEKIGRYAETVATNAGQSRRGFLGLMGKGALSLAGLVGGLLLVPGDAVAATKSTCMGGCRYLCPDGSRIGGACTKVCNCKLTENHGGMTCTLEASNCGFVW